MAIEPEKEASQGCLLPFLASLTGFLGLLRAYLNFQKGDPPDDTVLYYLCVSGALAVFRHVRELRYRDLELKLGGMEKVMAGVVATNVAANDNTGWTSPTIDETVIDPNKGKFGSLAVTKNRRLSASVQKSTVPSYYVVDLQVASTSPSEPLTGKVQFFLHPTFTRKSPVVAVDQDGVARLSLSAWGAFTVGALLDDGKTQLELDLAQLSGVDPEFANR